MQPPTLPEAVAKQETRRVKYFLVRPGDFALLFTKGLKVVGGWKVIKGLPKDAKLLTVANDDLRGGLIMVVESAEYDPVPTTELPPIAAIAINLNDRHIKRPK